MTHDINIQYLIASVVASPMFMMKEFSVTEDGLAFFVGATGESGAGEENEKYVNK